MWKIARQLKAQGVLGLNRRNGDYALRYNPRKNYPLVDDKLQSKQLAIEAGIGVPSLYQSITAEHQLKSLDRLLEPYTDFVIKPAHGAGGDGIVVVASRVFEHYRQISGTLLTLGDLQYHLSSLLSGAYSLGGHPDHGLIERRVIVDPVFEAISYEGVPDIRVISLLGYPAMAMLRLPTRASNGKANLHQGAIGVGIDLATGLTCGGVLHNDAIDYHPDTLNSTVNIQVPYWDTILEMAARGFELTGLGYLGVDIVLDKTHGPLMLELNARPGLNIQIANREGLLARYEAIEAEAAQGVASVAERVAFSKAFIGGGPKQVLDPPESLLSHQCIERADALHLDG
ncbi:MAG: alpha-L-glutamate ligase-like protein [Legionellaceae bacterium]|nr:alpha-L-glutamate ligase-like protein [Legionellaceae bacterium]